MEDTRHAFRRPANLRPRMSARRGWFLLLVLTAAAGGALAENPAALSVALYENVDPKNPFQELDQALSALLIDLEKNRLAEQTLVVVATEFGRPPEFDAGGGRGHQSAAFSVLLARGGLRRGRVIGETDELSRKVISRPVSVPDFHATIHCALGINPAKNLYAGDRPVPITDGGRALTELFS